MDLYELKPVEGYSVSSSRLRTSWVGSKSQLSSSPTNSKPAKPVARMNPYFGWPIASLTAPIANGPTTADRQVKKRITPAMAPCSDFGKQLIPLELMLG